MNNDIKGYVLSELRVDKSSRAFQRQMMNWLWAQFIHSRLTRSSSEKLTSLQKAYRYVLSEKIDEMIANSLEENPEIDVELFYAAIIEYAERKWYSILRGLASSPKYSIKKMNVKDFKKGEVPKIIDVSIRSLLPHINTYIKKQIDIHKKEAENAVN